MATPRPSCNRGALQSPLAAPLPRQRRHLLRAVALAALLVAAALIVQPAVGSAHVVQPVGGQRGGQLEVEAASLGLALARGITVVVGVQIGAKFAKEVYKQADKFIEGWVSELASSRLAHGEVPKVQAASQVPPQTPAGQTSSMAVAAALVKAMTCVLGLWALRSAVVFSDKVRSSRFESHECPGLTLDLERRPSWSSSASWASLSPIASPRVPTPPVWAPLR